MKAALVALLLEACLVAALAEEGPPALIWVKETPQWIHEVQHIIPAMAGGFIAATVPSTAHKPIVRLDESGNVLWEAGYCGIGFAYWVEELPDGSIVATGYGSDPENTTYGLWISSVSSGGSPLWYRVYEISGSIAEKGLCIEPLPDGGFAVCGQRAPQNSWLLRTNADGDTLWTRVWDSGTWDRARRVVFYANGLTVFVDGASTGGPYLLRYDMSGNLQWVSDFTGQYEPSDYSGGSLCIAPDGGYAFVTSEWSDLVHTDVGGTEQWSQQIEGTGRRTGFSLDPTMDDGYVFSGWENYYIPPDGVAPSGVWTYDGWLVKLDSAGRTEWHILNEIEDRSSIFNCARQLSQGGYIVAGQIWDEEYSDWNGYLLRYAPETGIESDPDMQEQGLSLSPSCNPFSSSVSITCSGPSLPGQLMVYDITGRLIRSLSECEGTSFLWDGRDGSGAEVPVGTYLIRGTVGGQVSSLRVVKL